MTFFDTLSCLRRHSKHALSNILITNKYVIYLFNKSMQILMYITSIGELGIRRDLFKMAANLHILDKCK